ncbi:MAG: tetratricopeptide repeat protein [Phycisphaerales bacterium]|nr:tetratricopeptide repeat protein [Phycisphaerales bacterium]
MRGFTALLAGVSGLVAVSAAWGQADTAPRDAVTIQDALDRHAIAQRRERDVIRLDLRKLVDQRKAPEWAEPYPGQRQPPRCVVPNPLSAIRPERAVYLPFNPYAARSLDQEYRQWAEEFDYHLQKGYGMGYDDLGYRYAKEQALNLDRYLGSGAGGRYGGSDVYRGRRVAPETSETRSERLNLQDSNRRAERLLSRHRAAYEEGATLLRAGQTRAAIAKLTLATQLNHADPAARILLSQARLSLGEYEAAGAALRRAFELQPNAVYESLSLDEYHPEVGLGARTDELAAWMARESASKDVYLLRAYLEWRRGKLDVARAALERLLKADPDDEPAKALMGLVGGE